MGPSKKGRSQIFLKVHQNLFFFALGQNIFRPDSNGPVVAGEHSIRPGRPCALRKEAHHRHNHHGQKHTEHTRVERVFEHERKERGSRHIDPPERDAQLENHHACPKHKACHNGGPCRFFPVKAIEERSQERARQSAPRNAHELSDERCP